MKVLKQCHKKHRVGFSWAAFCPRHASGICRGTSFSILVDSASTKNSLIAVLVVIVIKFHCLFDLIKGKRNNPFLPFFTERQRAQRRGREVLKAWA